MITTKALVKAPGMAVMVAAAIVGSGDLAAQILTFEYNTSWSVIDTHNANVVPTNPSYAGVWTNPAAAGSNRGYTSTNWFSGFNSTQYLAFSITANPSYQFTVNSVGFNTGANATGTFTGRLMYSTDGSNFFNYGSDVNLRNSVIGTPTTFTQTVSSTARQTIDFRLFVDSSSTSYGLFVGNVPSIDDAIVVNGSVSAVPEPSYTIAAVAVGAAAAIARRRRSSALKVDGVRS